MSAALWGLIGVVVGGLVTVAGNIVMHRLEGSDRDRRESSEAEGRAREERKLAYLRLLTVARRLRYVARPDAKQDVDAIDNLRTELSSVTYEIALIAPLEMVQLSDAVRRTTFDYLNQARREIKTGAAATHIQSPDAKALRHKARRAVNGFIAAARGELDLRTG